MKIKKLLPVHATSYYCVLLKELRNDFERNAKQKKQKLKTGTCYDKRLKIGNKEVIYKVNIVCLEENVCYEVRMDYEQYSHLISHRIKQLDSDGVISIMYEEKVQNCSILMKLLFSLKARFVRIKVMQFLNYLYKEAEQLESS